MSSVKVRILIFILDNDAFKQTKFKDLLESLDRLSIIEENYEEQFSNSELDDISNKTVRLYSVFAYFNI